MHIDHINIAAPLELLEEVRDFYCAVLGLRDGFRPAFSQRGFWLYSDDKPWVHLSERASGHSAGGQGYLDHVAFQANGLEAMIGRLVANDVKYRSSHIPEFNMSQLFFKDPAGNGLEVNFPNET